MHRYPVARTFLALVLGVLGCSGSGGGGSSTDAADSAAKDRNAPEIAAPDVEETSPADVPRTDTVVAPPATCLGKKEAGQALTLPGLDAPVEVVTDTHGIPHVYATTEHDLWIAQGYVVASNRFVQMHAMRRIASGTWSAVPAAGKGDLSNDVYMRVLGLRHVADQMWADVEANNAPVKAMLEAFSSGVNAFIEGVGKGSARMPLEWAFLGKVEPWTPVDCLTIGRLQSWDLSFEGNLDEIAAMARFQELTEKWGGTPLAGIVEDVMRFEPATDALTLPSDARRAAAPARFGRLLSSPFYRTFRPGYFAGILKGFSSVPLNVAPGSAKDTGSNNWVVSGKVSADGAAMLANDTHLSLRNPSVFFNVHLNTMRAGGTLDLLGVTFPGIPSIILGRNAHVAWGGTVYYADVTDIYVEKVTAGDPPSVDFNGKSVPMVVRKEVFDYGVPAEGCESWLDDFIKGNTVAVEEKDGRCVLTVDVLDVPHHGPVVPGSMGTDRDGNAIALTWKWTGFEPTAELEMVRQFGTMASPDDFKKALESFGVGAQNWVYADDAGRIAYAAFVRLPVRKNLETQPVDFPPFLPMPGTGCCEWDGFVPLADMPQSVDPEQGYVASANGDAFGYSLDNDPFNDPTYQGYMFDIGFRTGRIHERLDEGLSGGKKLAAADLQAIQADHLSPLGKRFTPLLLDALAAAEAMKQGDPGYDPDLAALLGADVLAARDRLAKWSYAAEAGTEEEATPAEKDDAVATAIFNTWVVYLSNAVLKDKLETGLDFQVNGRFLVNLLTKPDTLATYDAALKDSVLWDDTTTQKVETRTYVMVKALKDALAFLADPAVVGVAAAGGFGTDDMSQWLWGKLHTVTLKHALGGEANIPPAGKFPEGYPRHGDNFVVDAANPGLTDTSYTFSSGAAIRNVFVLQAGQIKAHMVIPGGQDGAAFAPHYSDLFYLWAKNETVAVPAAEDEVLAAFESCSVLKP